MSSLRLHHVSHRYPESTSESLSDVSVQVDDGQMVSVVGPSGSGKTTLLRVAAGLEMARSGRVEVDDLDVAGLPTERRDVTVMFQQPLLFDHLDVGGNVGFAPRLAGVGRRESRRCAQRYLRLVHLDGYAGRSVASLSGGQQQRVALARALAAERGALLLDEPFNSLDRELRTSMHELLTEVRAALAPTILMVTHDPDEAALAESTVVLIDGSVHQVGPMPTLYQQPATVETARLLGGFTEVPGTVVDGVHRSAWGPVPLPAGCRTTGAALLLLRREVLHLDPVVPGSGAGDGRDPGIGARVVRVRSAGARQIAVLLADDQVEVEVELPWGVAVGAGSQWRVRLPDHAARWAVPVDSGPTAAEPTGDDSTSSDLQTDEQDARGRV